LCAAAALIAATVDGARPIRNMVRKRAATGAFGTARSSGAAIGMMMWMWISSIVILFGAQLNSEIEHQTAHDSTTEHDKPLGARGAVMADTVGAST
jgi:uncharacterized BrkB/YihY/UPF0761 family membrane protein